MSNLRHHQITAWPSFRLEERSLSRQLSNSQPYACSAKECLNLNCIKRYKKVNYGQVHLQSENPVPVALTRQLLCKMHVRQTIPGWERIGQFQSSAARARGRSCFMALFFHESLLKLLTVPVSLQWSIYRSFLNVAKENVLLCSVQHRHGCNIVIFFFKQDDITKETTLK